MSDRFFRNAVVLGLLSAIGPFAIDMYLPAMPVIARDLDVSTVATQLTLTVFFIGFGAFQIVFGPLSDMLGRKPPLYAGLALFAVGSIGCGLSPNLSTLIACRFLQGLGASAFGVISRAIVRDLHTGTEATRLMALIMLVFSVSPLLAPLTGSGLIALFGWRAVFAAITVAAILGFILLTTLLPETLPRQQRIAVRAGDVLAGFGKLFRDWRFLGLTIIGGLAMSSFFVFLASSSFLYITHFGLTPTQFSFAFAVNAIGFIGASQFAAPLGARFGAARVVLGAIGLSATFALVLCVVTWAGFQSLGVLVVLLFVSFAWLGLVIPSSMVLSLEHHGDIAGIASALGGTLQMVTGGLLIPVVGFFFDGTARPMVTTIALCTSAALVVSLLTLRERGLAAQAA